MPSSASPKPAPSSPSPSGIISVPGSMSPETLPSPTSRNSSADPARHPDLPEVLPLLPKMPENCSPRGVAVVGRSFLLAAGRAFARIHIEHDGLRRSPPMRLADPLAGQIGLAQRLRLEAIWPA